MRLLKFGFLAVLLSAAFFFLTPAVKAQDTNLLIDSLEISVTAGPAGTVDFGSGGGSEVKVGEDRGVKHQGDSSIKVDYDAVSGGYMWIARGFGLEASNAGWDVPGEKVDWDKYQAISFYIYGDDSKTQVAFDLKDDGGEMWRRIFTDDFKGWKQIVCAFNEFYARSDWQPDAADKNGELNFPLKSYQFEPLAPAKGAFYFDQVEAVKK